MSTHKTFTPRVLLRAEESEGAAGIVEITVPAHWEGPPLHHHPFDEAFYVLDGELTFQLGDARRTATVGDVAFARGGQVHTLANHADAPARYVLVITPAGFERHFDRIAAEAAGVEPPASALQPYPETTVVGPRIADRGAKRRSRSSRADLAQTRPAPGPSRPGRVAHGKDSPGGSQIPAPEKD